MLQWILKATPSEYRQNVLKRIIYLFVFSLLILFMDPVSSKWLIYFLVFFVLVGSVMYAKLPYGTRYILRDDGIVINDLNNRKAPSFYPWDSLKTFQIINTEKQVWQVADKSDFEGMEGKLVIFLIDLKYGKYNRKTQIMLKAPQEIEQEVISVLDEHLTSYHYVVEKNKV